MITTTNQQPAILPSMYDGNIAGQFDPYEIIKTQIIPALFQNVVANAPAVITEDNTPLTPDDITMAFLDCSGDTIDPAKEDRMKEILSQTLAYYGKSLTVQEVYAEQAGKQCNMLLPSAKVMYTPTDVIDGAKQLLAGQITKDGFFANLAFYARPNLFGYYFANANAWEEFKTWFANEISAIQPLLPQETIQLCGNLQNIKLNNLTESFVLRDNDTQNNDPYSFARVFMFYLLLYEKQKKTAGAKACEAGSLPFTFAELFCPRAVVIVNLEKHAHARPQMIKDEWDVIRASLQMRPTVIGKKQLCKLTAIAKMAHKMAASTGQKRNAFQARSAIIKFRKTAPTSVDLYKYIMRIYKNAVHVQHSENAFKNKRPTFNKPSRRHPDDPDKMGIASKTMYRPDLHIYLDCSGSISEREYQDAIKACIKLAIKMNVNFYFNSFSHCMSSATKLHIEGHTPKQIYNEFKNTPKVAGGTDYEQIWHYINRSKKTGREVSIIISDFEYYAPNHYVKHPRFLYYAPISTVNWDVLKKDAEAFCKSMLSICPNIRQHILM